MEGKKHRGMIKVTKVLSALVLYLTDDFTEERLIARGMKSGHNYFPIMAQMHPFQSEFATSDEVYLIKPESRVFVSACLHLSVCAFVQQFNSTILPIRTILFCCICLCL